MYEIIKTNKQTHCRASEGVMGSRFVRSVGRVAQRGDKQGK